MNNLIILDIREDFEVLENNLISNSPNVFIVNIPSSLLFSNISWIEKMTQKNTKILIICTSSKRSKVIKQKYFLNNNNVIVLDDGVKGNLSKYNIKLVKGSGGFGLTHYYIISFLLILFTILLLHLSRLNKKMMSPYIIFIILFFIYTLFIHKFFIINYLTKKNHI